MLIHPEVAKKEKDEAMLACQPDGSYNIKKKSTNGRSQINKNGTIGLKALLVFHLSTSLSLTARIFTKLKSSSI